MSSTQHVVCPHCDTINRLPVDRPATAGKCGRCKEALFEGHPLDLDAQRFQQHLAKSDLPLLVDFWAPWCGPCRQMAPAFAAAARQLEPGLRLVKVNTEEEQHLAAQYGIRSIPTLMLLHHGREIARVAGAMDTRGLLAWVAQQLR